MQENATTKNVCISHCFSIDLNANKTSHFYFSPPGKKKESFEPFLRNSNLDKFKQESDLVTLGLLNENKASRCNLVLKKPDYQNL